MTKKLDNKSTNNKHCKAFWRFFLLIFKMKLSQIDKDILHILFLIEKLKVFFFCYEIIGCRRKRHNKGKG